jgi:hypothetical protein
MSALRRGAQSSSTTPALIATPAGRRKHWWSLHLVMWNAVKTYTTLQTASACRPLPLCSHCGFPGGWTRKPMAGWGPCQQSCGSQRRLTNAAKRCRRCSPAPHTPSRSSIRCATDVSTLHCCIMCPHRDVCLDLVCTDDVPCFAAFMKAPGEMTQAQRDFPLPTACEDVFHCGFASEDSFGATSWLVRRPEGNVMMDSPRYHPGLSKRLQVSWW